MKFPYRHRSKQTNKIQNRALPGYYAAYSGNSVPTFRGNLSVPSSGVKNLLGFLTLEDGTDRLSRNVGTESPMYAE